MHPSRRTWLKVLADPAASIVPTHADARGVHVMGPPAARKPADVVITTRALHYPATHYERDHLSRREAKTDLNRALESSA
jgi:hypothetical protein